MTFDICFATYCSQKWLKTCVEALAKVEYDTSNLFLYFADNASTDDTIAVLEQLQKQYEGHFGAFEILPDQCNRGFGAASNRAARAGKSEYVFFLNIDTEIHLDAFRQLEQAIQGAPASVGGFELRQEPYEFPKYYDPITLETSWISGAAFVMPRPVFELTGGFDERIFMYCEDVDLSWNICSRGYTLQYVPTAVVDHHSGDVKAPPKRLALIYSAAGNAYLRLKYGSEKDIQEIPQITDSFIAQCRNDLSAVWQIQNQIQKVFALKSALDQERESRAAFMPSFHHMDYEWRRAGYDVVLKAATHPLSISVIVLADTYIDGNAKKALKTLQHQTCSPEQVLVVTADPQYKNVEKEFSELPLELLFIEGPLSKTQAFNTAFSHVTGEYCQVLCDEAYLFADHFETLSNMAQTADSKELFCSSALKVFPDDKATDLSGRVLRECFSFSGQKVFRMDKLLERSHFSFNDSMILFSRSLWEKVGQVPADLGFLAFRYFWIKCLSFAPVCFSERDGLVWSTIEGNYLERRTEEIGQEEWKKFQKTWEKITPVCSLKEIQKYCWDAHIQTEKRWKHHYEAMSLYAQSLKNAPQREPSSAFKKVRAFLKGNRVFSKMYTFLAHCRYEGVTGGFRWLQKVLYLKKNFYINELHVEKFAAAAALIRQKKRSKAANAVKFTVVLNQEDAPSKSLRLAIESLQNQTYENWELLIDDRLIAQEPICKEKMGKDGRIRSVSFSDNAFNVEGDYITALSGWDFLHPTAFYHLHKELSVKDQDILYTDEIEFLEYDLKYISYRCKPDYAPDTFLSHPYLHCLTVIRVGLAQQQNILSSQVLFDWNKAVLWCARQTSKIGHLPYALYYTHIKSDDIDRQSEEWAEVVREELQKEGAEVLVTPLKNTKHAAVRIHYPVKKKNAKVSIIIQNKDQIELLKKCMDSIFKNDHNTVSFEVLIVENNSTTSEIFEYYQQLQEQHSEVGVLIWDKAWNYSALNNFAARAATGEYLLFLNNDIEVLTPNWLDEMVMFAQRPDVGAVGAKMYYTDGEVQHGGVIIGLNGSAGHSHRFAHGSSTGYEDNLAVTQNMSAVTGACLLVPRSVYDRVGGFDEKLAVALNDVDFCLKIRALHKLVVFTPFVELLHDESKTRGDDAFGTKWVRNQYEVGIFLKRWKEILKKGDPYYNMNLSKDEKYETAIQPIPEGVEE